MIGQPSQVNVQGSSVQSRVGLHAGMCGFIEQV
jgi:hypothetical protein